MTWPSSDRPGSNPFLTSPAHGVFPTNAVDLSSFSEFLRRQAPELLPTGSLAGARTAAGMAQGDALPHGTTIVALRYPGGVLIAWDRRSTQGNMIAGRDV